MPTSVTPAPNPGLHRFAVLTAVATLGLVGVGGLVTSHGAGMAVPDWPNTYGYNMFFFPFSQWVGGVFYEHSHRLFASGVGLLTVVLALWLHGRNARPLMRWVGAILLLLGAATVVAMPRRWTDGLVLGVTGQALLSASRVWPNCEPSPMWLRRLGLVAFVAVVLQGILGGLRVVLFKDALGIFHATLAQLFFTLVCAIALFTSRWWQTASRASAAFRLQKVGSGEGAGEGEQPPRAPALLQPGGCAPMLTGDRQATPRQQASTTETSPAGLPSSLSHLPFIPFLLPTLLILIQLTLGATMRHQHAGLAIPDFPLAYGKLWPAMDAESVLHYNQQRIEVTSLNPITAFQIGLQMVHRLFALAILGAVAYAAWSTRRRCGAGNPLSRMALTWLGVILAQSALGAATIWSNKAADIATAHVLVGALALALGAILCIVSGRFLMATYSAPDLSIPAEARPLPPFRPLTSTVAGHSHS